MPDMYDLFQWASFGLLALATALHQDRVTATLWAGLIASYLAVDLLPEARLLLILFTVDLFVVVALGRPHTQHPNKRAAIIAMIGGAKLVWGGMVFGSGGGVSFYTYALVMNCAFLLQVIVAGGFVDAIGHWLDDYWRRLAPRGHHAFWHLEGE